VIDSGDYEQKIVTGTASKLVFVWLYWAPEAPPAAQPSTPTPRRPKKTKKEKGVKEEKGIKVEPTLKRLRAASGEVSIPKRSGIVTRRQAKALDEGPSEDDDLEALTEMIGGVGRAAKSGGEVDSD